MKYIKILVLFFIPFLAYSQDTHPDYTTSQLDSILLGLKKVDIPTHFNSNGDFKLKDIDVKSLVDKIIASVPSGSADTRLQLSAVNDSLKIEVVDVLTNTVTSTSYLDNMVNQPDIITTITDTLVGAHLIANYTNEANIIRGIYESIIQLDSITNGYVITNEAGIKDTIKIKPANTSQIIALQDTTGCTSWTLGSANFQINNPTADSLLFITINGTNYPINLPMDDGSTGSIPPAIAALMQTAIGNAITSAGYSATTSVGPNGIFTNITFQLTAGNSPLTIQFSIVTGGFYTNYGISKSVPYNCTYTNRAIKPTDTQLAVNTCPAITLAYSEGDLDTLRVYDCNTNDWRIVGAEHDYNYSLSPLIVGVDTTGFILNKNGVPQDTVLLCSGGSNTVVDTRLQLSVVNDSLKVEIIDVASNTVISTSYLDGVINKDLVIPTENTCITTTDEVVIKKSDGSLVSKPNNAFKKNEVFPVGNYTVSTSDQIIYAVGGSTITLPTCISNCTEKTIYRDACSDGLITVNVAGGGKIDGVHTSRTLPVGRGGYTYECVGNNWRIKSEFFEPDVSQVAFSLLNSTTANVTVYTLDGLPYTVNFEDGNGVQTFASGVTANTAYSSPFTGNVLIGKTCSVAPIYRIIFNGADWNFDVATLQKLPSLTQIEIYSGTTFGDIANLPSGLGVYKNSGQNTTTGNIANLPSGLGVYDNRGQNTTFGDIANLPNGLGVYNNSGQNTTTGDIANLPNGLTYYGNYGQNTTTGDIANLLSGLGVYDNRGQNTTFGDIANLPSGLTYYYNSGQNTTTGNIANLPSGLGVYDNSGQNTTYGNIANLPNGLTYYSNSGQNTTFGDIANLPSGLTFYLNYGQNTTTGDIANLLSGLGVYDNRGQNTTFGDIANLPNGLTYYSNSGQNTTTGDIANLPNGLTFYSNYGQNTVSDYSGGNLNSGFTYFYSFTTSGGLSAAEVDNLFIELESTLPGIYYINITGTNAAPTAASLTARNNLIASGCTVIHN